MSSKKPNYTSAAAAEAAFYEALTHSDLDAMMSVWSDEQEVVCIHPGGPRIVGLESVREVWRQMLSSAAHLRIDVTQAVVSSNAMMAMLADIETRMPGRKDAMLRALGHTNPSHLLDPKLFDFSSLETVRKNDDD